MVDLRFRDEVLSKRVVEKIRELQSTQDLVKICHVCGTHEWTITHFGLRSLLPENVEVIAGPGCPVCITPASEIDQAIQLARKGVIITCFGDVLRVPGSDKSLLEARANGSDVRVVYSANDAVKMAKKEKDRDFTFFAVGFETTAPSTAVEVLTHPPRNLSFLVSHRLIPPAMQLLAGMKDLSLDGFIAPGHVSTIIGLRPYEIFPRNYSIPTVVAGFEPLDVLFGVYMILRQLADGKPRLENEYARAVREEGNVKAQELLAEVFQPTTGNWRGLGSIQASTLKLRRKFQDLEACSKHGVQVADGTDIRPGCKCHLVIIGKIQPTECSLFMKTCTPQNPVGPCMVSNEGTCRIWTIHSHTQTRE